jgi:hypothetical protein
MRMMVLAGVERGAKGEDGSKPTIACGTEVEWKERRAATAAGDGAATATKIQCRLNLAA